MLARVVTYSTNATLLLLLQQSLERVHVPLVTLPPNAAHREPYWQKIYALAHLEAHIPPSHLVLFADGFDTIVQQNASVIYSRFHEFARQQRADPARALVFNGIGTRCFPYDLQSEKWPSDVIWEINGKEFTGADACRRFQARFRGANHALNSGLILGRASSLQKFMDHVWHLRYKPFYTEQSAVIALAHVYASVYVDSNNTLFGRPARPLLCSSWTNFPHGSVLAYHLTGLPSLRSRCRSLAYRALPGSHPS